MVNKQALFFALDKVVNSRISFIEEVIAAGYPTIESARPHIMEYVSIRVGCPIKVKGTGAAVFDSTSEKSGSARNMLRDINLWLTGTSRRQSVAANKAASPQVSRKAAPLTAAQKKAIADLITAFGGDRKAARSAV
jgi:hypothetical protein